VRAIVNDAGEIVCYEGSLEDITERKLMEEAEKEQRMLAEAFVIQLLLFQAPWNLKKC